jgi:hypothetical protein
MEKLVTLKKLGSILRDSCIIQSPSGAIMLNEQNTGYSVSTCHTFDADGRNLGRIVTAYHRGDDTKNMIVAVNGKVRVFKTLNAVEKALFSIDMEGFMVYLV